MDVRVCVYLPRYHQLVQFESCLYWILGNAQLFNSICYHKLTIYFNTLLEANA